MQHLTPGSDRLLVVSVLQKAQDIRIQEQRIEVGVVRQGREQIAPVQSGDDLVGGDGGVLAQS